MPHATMELPSLLQTVVGGTASLTVEGDSLGSALEDAYRQIPVLRGHLCDESGRFRPHVLCFVNGVNTRWLTENELRLNDGDEITIIQAVSGG